MEERFKTFTVLMARINRNIRRIKTEEMDEYDLKSHHVSCLYYLFQYGTLTAKELCDVCDEDKANISRSVDYLEKNGFVSCLSASHKRYKSPLELTEKGRRTAQGIAHKIDRLLAEAGEGLSEEKRLSFYQSLALISDNLQKICDRYDEEET